MKYETGIKDKIEQTKEKLIRKKEECFVLIDPKLKQISNKLGRVDLLSS